MSGIRPCLYKWKLLIVFLCLSFVAHWNPKLSFCALQVHPLCIFSAKTIKFIICDMIHDMQQAFSFILTVLFFFFFFLPSGPMHGQGLGQASSSYFLHPVVLFIWKSRVHDHQLYFLFFLFCFFAIWTLTDRQWSFYEANTYQLLYYIVCLKWILRNVPNSAWKELSLLNLLYKKLGFLIVGVSKGRGAFYAECGKQINR